MSSTCPEVCALFLCVLCSAEDLTGRASERARIMLFKHCLSQCSRDCAVVCRHVVVVVVVVLAVTTWRDFARRVRASSCLRRVCCVRRGSLAAGFKASFSKQSPRRDAASCGLLPVVVVVCRVASVWGGAMLLLSPLSLPSMAAGWCNAATLPGGLLLHSCFLLPSVASVVGRRVVQYCDSPRRSS